MSTESVCVKALVAELLSLTYTNIASSASRHLQPQEVCTPDALIENALAGEFVQKKEVSQHSDEDSAEDECGDEDDSASGSDADDGASSESDPASLESPASGDDSNVEEGDESESDASENDDSMAQESDSNEDKVPDSSDTVEGTSAQGASKPQHILKEKLEKSLKHLQQKSEEVDKATSAYLKKQEELLIESHKSMSESMHRSSKEVQQNCGGLVGHVTESMQKGLDMAKTKSDIHSARVTKGFAYAEKKAKGVADSTRDKVNTFFRKQPFRFGA